MRDPAPPLHLAACALDQHGWTGYGRDVARRGLVELAGASDSPVANVAVQPAHLRRQRRLRPGDRRPEPSQGHARRGEDRAYRGQAHRARRSGVELAVPYLFRIARASIGRCLDAPVRTALCRLLCPARALQGPPLPGLSEQRRLRLPARLHAARPRREPGLARGDRAYGLERGQARLRRRPGRGRRPHGRHHHDRCKGWPRWRRPLERSLLDAGHGVFRPRKLARRARKRGDSGHVAVLPLQKPDTADGTPALQVLYRVPLCGRYGGGSAARRGAVARGLPVSRVVVVGGGLGGLASAALLGRAGHEVTLLEANPWLGGKSRRIELDGRRMDTGPSLLTFPGVWDEFLRRWDVEGENPGEASEVAELKLKRLPEVGRYFYKGEATSLPVEEGHPWHEAWERFANVHGGLGPEVTCLLTSDPADRGTLPALARLLRIYGPMLTTRSYLDGLSWLPEGLKEIIAIHALNAGVAPGRTPALYASMPAIMANDGVFVP